MSGENVRYPSVEKPWMDYYSENAKKDCPVKCSIYENIYRRNKDYPNDTALYFFSKKYTYGDLFAKVNRCAGALKKLGVKEGDNVLFLCLLTPETVFAILALNRLGANAVLLSPLVSEEQFKERVKESEADILFINNDIYPRFKNVLPVLSIKTMIAWPVVNSLGFIAKTVKKTFKNKVSGSMSWNTFESYGDPGYQSEELSYVPDRPAIVVNSSGTTAAAKGIQLTNDSINRQAWDTEYAAEGTIKRGERYLAQIPVWSATCIAATVINPLICGVGVIIVPLFDHKMIMKEMLSKHPQYLITIPTLIEYLIDHKECDSAYRDIKHIYIGGDYITPLSEQRANLWLKKNGNGIRIIKGYGMGECGATVSFGTDNNNPLNTSGIPLPNSVAAVFDLETGDELGYGEKGEIYVQSPGMMLGYFKKPEETEKFFITDKQGRRWAKTGDMGFIREDGNIVVLGRISHSYVNGTGETIYLFDIERAILNIPAVKMCKVTSSVISGERTHVCHICLHEDTRKDKEILKMSAVALCQDSLPESYWPKYFKFYKDSLPISKSGKCDMALMASDLTDIEVW